MPPTFTTLPLEIRNDIYGRVYGHAVPMIQLEPLDTFVCMTRVCSDKRDKDWYTQWYTQSRLPLLLVNRQISDEAAAVVYRKIKIFPTNCQTRHAFCRIGARYLKYVQVVDFLLMEVVREVVEDACRAFEVLDNLPNLRSIRVIVVASEVPILQDALDQGSVKNFAGRCDIHVTGGLRKTRTDRYLEYRRRHRSGGAKA